MNVKFVEWIDKDNRIARLEITSLEIPVNVEVLDDKLVNSLSSGKEYNVIVWADNGGEFEVYKDIDEYENRKDSSMAPQSLIPCGTFPVKENPDFKESAFAIINGIVSDVVEGNTEDGRHYWGTEIKTVEDFPMHRYCFEPVELNNVVSGIVWLTIESNE